MRNSVQVAIGLCTLLMTSAGASPAQFDLACKVVEAGMDVDGTYTPSKSVDLPPIRLSIDLTKKGWCYQPCRQQGDVESTSSEIKLTGGPGSGFERRYMIANRSTGALMRFTHLPTTGTPMIIKTTYDCSARSFTALPGRRF
jgi:hypothetical protein